jgi:hypothetical protein
MLLRRMLLFASLLLVMGAIASAFTPRKDRATAPPRASAPAPAANTQPRRIEATLPADTPVRARVGDIVRLSVRAPGPEQVDIPDLGVSEPADTGVPAVFEIVTDQQGRYPVMLSLADKSVGVVEVQPAR